MATSEKFPSIREQGESSAETMRRAFKRADSESSGKIPCEQFSTAVKEAGYDASTENIEKIFSKFDKTPDSEINFDEFVDMMKYIEDCNGQDFEANLREAFKKFDRDGSGYISPEELRYVVCHTGEKLSQGEAEELIEMFDTNKDGQLSWEEFVEFIKTSMMPGGSDEQGEASLLDEEERGGDDKDDAGESED